MLRHLFLDCILILLTIFLSFKYSEQSSSTQQYNDEYRLPNGTVMGRYSYIDKEGNSVHVKYFADDEGYGVQLKSIKMSPSFIEAITLHNAKEEKAGEKDYATTPLPMANIKERKIGLRNAENTAERRFRKKRLRTLWNDTRLT